MEIKVIASGSSGNCYKVSDGTTTLMIEAGIVLKKIQEGFDFNLSEVAGCLISHEHMDHARSAKKVMKYGVNCYASQGTISALKSLGRGIRPMPKRTIKIGTFTALGFKVQHQAAEPLGFLIESTETGERLVFITDSYYCRYKFENINYFMVECNFSKIILDENIRGGVTSITIRKKIVANHFELENTKEFFQTNDTSKVKKIYLIHLSQKNSDENLFKTEIQKITGRQVIVA